MLIQKQILTLLLLILFATSSFGQSQKPISDIESALAHQKLAREYLEQKKWLMVRDEAKLATSAAPTNEINRDAWLLLAASEDRLRHYPEARDAYEKYLSLAPTPIKKQAVMARFEELKTKTDNYQRYKWGAQSGGLVIGHSPTFNTKMQKEISSDLKAANDFGLRFGQMSFGYKRGVGKSGAFQAPTSTSSTATYATLAAGSRHVVEEVYFQYDIALTDKPDMKSLVWSVPMYVAGVSNGTRTPDGKLFSSFGMDFGAGLKADVYTKSALSFDVSAIYHLGIPFTDAQNVNDWLPIKNPSGEIISGSTSGTEVRFGLKLLFGATPPQEEE